MSNKQTTNACKICRKKEGLVVYKGTHICSECITYIKTTV